MLDNEVNVGVKEGDDFLEGEEVADEFDGDFEEVPGLAEGVLGNAIRASLPRGGWRASKGSR